MGIIQKLEKEEQTKPQASRRKEIIKIRAEINDLETTKTVGKINETESWFFEMINKIDQPLAKFIKKKMERMQVYTVRNEKGEITIVIAEIQRIIITTTSNQMPIQWTTSKKWTHL